MRLEPAFKDNLWGGTKLRTVFGKKCDYDVIGESWELSAHPDGQSVIASGIFTGMYFGEFIENTDMMLLAGRVVHLTDFLYLLSLLMLRRIYRFRFTQMMIMLLRLRMNSVKMRCGM